LVPAFDRVQIRIEQGFCLIALVLGFRAEFQNLPHDFRIEAGALGLCELVGNVRRTA
jgi:hypothetical protein